MEQVKTPAQNPEPTKLPTRRDSHITQLTEEMNESGRDKEAIAKAIERLENGENLRTVLASL